MNGWLITIALKALSFKLTICAVLTVLELTLPREAHSMEGRIRAIYFTVVSIAFSTFFFGYFNVLWDKLGIRPLFFVDLSRAAESMPNGLQWVVYVGAPVLAATVADFFYYWFHRMQHSFPPLWRFHEVHHAITELNSINSNSHVLEELFKIPLMWIPMSLLVKFDLGYVPYAVGFLIGAHTTIQHSCTRLNYRYLRFFSADNSFHRIHHSVERKHYDRNFGSFTSIWDWMFGTAYWPEEGEWPKTGVVGIREPVTLKDYIMHPFRPRPVRARRQAPLSTGGQDPAGKPDEVRLVADRTLPAS